MLSSLLHHSVKLLSLLFRLNHPGILLLLFSDSHAADIDIEAELFEHTAKGRPMLISDEIPGKVAVKKVLARKQVSAEKLTMTLETGVIRRRLPSSRRF